VVSASLFRLVLVLVFILLPRAEVAGQGQSHGDAAALATADDAGGNQQLRQAVVSASLFRLILILIFVLVSRAEAAGQRQGHGRAAAAAAPNAARCQKLQQAAIPAFVFFLAPTTDLVEECVSDHRSLLSNVFAGADPIRGQPA
jgi:hypothetical protein